MRLVLFILVCFLLSVNPGHAQQSSGYQIIDTVEHDTAYFTQGLEMHEGLMYESSGLYGKSRVRKYKPDADLAISEKPLAERFFAEGLTVFDDEIFLLTWREKTLLVLNPADLAEKRQISYKGEGWGLASNASQLIMSDGSDIVTFRNPQSFRIEREISVRSQQHSVRRINELEFAQGYLWANIWQSPFIVKINPSTGNVVSFYDFRKLVKEHTSGNSDSVLNGIAYDSKRKAFWITGKLWSKRYLVKFDS